jgi:EAL domain-containing protein (putative c-di-GMP-specific phosphodiesterase class I)
VTDKLPRTANDAPSKDDLDSEVRLQTARAAPLPGKAPGGTYDQRRDSPTLEFSPNVLEALAMRTALTNDLSDAPSAHAEAGKENPFFDEVRPKDLSAVFQPIVNLASGTIFAYEALTRCSVPRFASPLKLFEHAASSRATGRLGRMIREVALPLCGGLPVFVNLHPNELEEGWLVRPDDPIFSHDRDVYLEITESAPMTHFHLCVSVLREVCSRASAHLVVDDLGAGYSNLKIIADLEPKVVKLDRSLVQDLDKKPRQRKLVASTVSLCKELGAAVVAEGIETAAELLAVIDSGAQFGQGYLLARPAFPMPTVNWPVIKV